MKIKLKRPYGEFSFEGYVSESGVEFDIPLELFIDELESYVDAGMSLRSAVDRVRRVIINESVKFASEIPIGK